MIKISEKCYHTIKAITNLSIIEIQLGETISALDKIKQEITF